MIIYYSDETTTIRSMKKEDVLVFYETYKSYGYHPEIATYEKYYDEQLNGKRKVFIVEYHEKICGICTLVLNSKEGPFAEMGYPEIVDLSIFLNYRRLGLGNKLLDIVETEAFKIANMVYLAVGLHSGYGSAQRIYVRRGYNFDGSGLWYQGKQLEQYAPCCCNDDLVLYMFKKSE